MAKSLEEIYRQIIEGSKEKREKEENEEKDRLERFEKQREWMNKTFISEQMFIPNPVPSSSSSAGAQVVQ